MTNRERWAVGLISGTSMDGVDAALVRITGTPAKPALHLERFDSIPYPPRVRSELLRLVGGEPAANGEISKLNFILGELFADAASTVCRKGGVPTQQLAVIGSHGQTVFHRGPRTTARDREMRAGSTLQIGEPAVIAERTGALVVADFRVADMAAGGEGAPLVPMVDYLLLRQPRRGSIALNLGGIANVTAIPPGAAPEEVSGFDTGPANMVIDGLVRRFTRGAKRYDADGAWARRGKVIEPLLSDALKTDFFKRQPPKSAGREQFGEEFLERYFISRRRARPEDLLATATELTAQSVARAAAEFILPAAAFHNLIISGGGAHNGLLIQRLTELLPSLKLMTSDQFGMPVDAKEAMAFALLADRTRLGLPGNLPTVTGARHAVVLGKIVLPRPGTSPRRPRH